MRKIRIIYFLLVAIMVTGFSGIALGAGIEPGAGGDDCDCLEMRGQPDVKIKGPYIKGTFTISNDPLNEGALPGFQQFITHIFLRWRNTVFLSSYLSFTGGAISVCDLPDEAIISGVYTVAAPCNLNIEVPYGLEGTPLIKEVIITDRGGCTTEDDITDDIVKGEIIIGVVPTSYILTETEEPPFYECVIPE